MTTEIAERPLAKPVILYSVTTETIEQMAAKFAGLKINGIDDKAGYQLVHSARMECVKARGAIEKTRKELKAESLEFGRKVDAEAKLLTIKIEEIEARLELEQQAIEHAKAKIKQEAEDKLFAERQAAWDAVDGPKTDRVYLLSHTADQFAARLEQQAEAKAKRIEAERIAAEQAEANRIEAERLAAERAELQRIAAEQEAERKRVQAIEDEARAKERAELDRQRKEQAEAQAKIDAENARIARAELEAANAKVIAQAKAEAAERARVETEERLKREAAEAEAKRVAEEAAAKRAEALKPIRDRLLKFADDVLRLETPDTTPEIDAAVLAVLNGAADAIRKIARGAK